MFHKLEEVARRYDQVTDMLSRPEVVRNQAEYQKLAKERSDLTALVEAYRRYQRVLKELEENREIFQAEKGDLKEMAREEIARLEADKAQTEQALKVLLLPRDPNDEKNIILEIRAGAGGDEASLFASDLFRMYSRYAERQGWKVEVLHGNAIGLGGFKEIVAVISGGKVYSQLKYEKGVHRVQRVPVTEAGGRIHTSTVTVAVLPEAEEVEVDIHDKDLRIDVYRSGGPGGQSVNTTDSAVRVTHLPTGLVVQCQDEKSQHKNKARAMKILRARLLEMMQEEQRLQISQDRRSQVGTGERSEKIRTYNFPQNRVTDHRIGLTLHRLTAILDGDFQEIIDALRTHAQAEALKGGEAAQA